MRNKKVSGWINCACVNLLLTFLLVTPANATNEYSFTSIDYPGAGIDVRGINNAGQIVGSVDHSDFSSDGFVLSGGSFTTFSFPGAFGTKAVGINDAGQIVGYYGGCCGAAQHGFLLSEGSLSTIDFPGTSSGDTIANGINNSGQIVGSYNLTYGGPEHGFLLSGGSFSTIDFPGASQTRAIGINDAGQIVGFYIAGGSHHGFLLSNGSFSTIDFPGAVATDANGINDSGQIAGSYAAGGIGHGFLFSGGSFSTIDFPGALQTNANGINNTGQVSGNIDAGGTPHGFLATPLPILNAVPSSLDFGDVIVNNAKELTFTVSNTGGGLLTGSVNTSAPFSIVMGGSFSLGAGQSQTVTARFSPTALGTFVGSASVTSNGGNATVSLSGTGVALPVFIDIKPGSFPNSINLGSGGTVPVAIFSTTTFDARTVDPTTVTLASASVALKGKGTLMTSFEDVNGDGLLDLVVHISTQALQLSEADEEAVLEGKTYGGTAVRGKDTVRVVP